MTARKPAKKPRAVTAVALGALVILCGCDGKKYRCTQSHVEHVPAYTTFAKVTIHHDARDETVCDKWEEVKPSPPSGHFSAPEKSP